MPKQLLVETGPPVSKPAIITEAEAAAMFRACLNLFISWKVPDTHAATLLDTAPRTFSRWKAGELGRIRRDQKARLSNLIAIHKELRIILQEPERAHSWINLPNRAFGMRTALNVMLGGELADIMRVRRYLNAERGG